MFINGPDWPSIHNKTSFGLWGPLLVLFSSGYGMGAQLRAKAYSLGYLKKSTLPGFTVSIGNLTVGGTGKTPAVIMLANWARSEGYNVAILSRGYRGGYRTKVLEVTDGSRIKADATEAGDEPYLIAKRLSGVPVVLSRKRYTAGLFAHEKFGSDFFILDDGFQHLELNRDLDLALIDASNPFGNGHLLPWGPLREPLNQLARADAAVLTRANWPAPENRFPDFFKEKFPETPLFFADHTPEKVVFPHLNAVYEPQYLKGKRIVAFAGIAHPDFFKKTLVKLGADPVHFRGFRDHHHYKPNEINALIKVKEKMDAQLLITTEKDWVKITSIAEPWADIGYLGIKFDLLSDHEDFFSIIKNSLNNRLK